MSLMFYNILLSTEPDIDPMQYRLHSDCGNKSLNIALSSVNVNIYTSHIFDQDGMYPSHQWKQDGYLIKYNIRLCNNEVLNFTAK